MSTAAAAGPCGANPPEGDERVMRKLKVSAQVATVDEERVISVKIVNRAKSPALGTNLTLVDAQGQPVLTAKYSDNCLTLPRGEPATISIRYPVGFTASVALRVEGWNVKPSLARIPAEAWSQSYLLQPWQQPTYTPPSSTVKSATVVLPKK